MEETGLWELFFATGLPEAYLAIRGERGEGEAPEELPAKTAFHPTQPSTRQI